MASWMVYLIAVTALLGAAAWAAERAARHHRAPTRWIWALAIVASLGLPTLIASASIQLPSFDMPRTWLGLMALRDLPSIVVPTVSQKRITLREETTVRVPPIRWLAADSAGGRNLNAALRRSWQIASILLLGALVASAAQVSWRKRRWLPGTVDGTSVYVSTTVGPAIVGLLRPRIVIPQWLLQASPARQAMVIAHERSHLHARDPQLLAVALCLLVLMPWNLPLWWQLRRLRQAIEVDCDARVVRRGYGVQQYGETLMDAGGRRSAFIGAVAAMAESRSFLEQRITLMTRGQGGSWRMAAVALGCVALSLVAVAAQVSPPNADSGSSPQHQIRVDPAVLDGYVGYYQFGPSAVMTVTRDGQQLITQLTGQIPVNIYPHSQTDFFTTVVDAQITFVPDERGQATALVLHQNGQTINAPRVDAAVAQQINSQTSAKVDSQTPTPGSEAALRRLIDGLISGKPNYEEMSPGLADATHTQLPLLQQSLNALGPIRSVQFRGVGPSGEDVYEVTQDHGLTEWRISLSPDGRIAGAQVTRGP